jgi:hypothetical protein
MNPAQAAENSLSYLRMPNTTVQNAGLAMRLTSTEDLLNKSDVFVELYLFSKNSSPYTDIESAFIF